jgi:YidC/Oxa1 family membrane protein insertase
MSISAALDAVLGVAHSALEGLGTFLTPTLAIIVFTVLIRLLISPLTWLQIRSAQRGAALAPQLAVLREKHRDDPMVLATETLALQRANGASPFAAMLPALAQAPFFMLMYHLVQSGWAGTLFGVPLAAHLSAGLPVFAVLLALSVALAWWSARRTRMQMVASGSAANPLTRIMGLLPYLTVVMVAWLPLAGGIYLVTSTAWTALEQLVLRRPMDQFSR